MPTKTAKPKAAKPKAKMGRPTRYTDEIAAEICGRLACGEPMSNITQDAHMPGMTTTYMWLRKRDDFRQHYEEARKDGAHTFADQIAKIIDEKPLQIVDENGNVKYDSGSISWQRLRMDGRKWLAAKYLPKVYGERMAVEGVEGGAPIKTEDVSLDKLNSILRNFEMTKRLGSDTTE